MVKRRAPLATAQSKPEPTAEQIEAFASGVDGGKVVEPVETEQPLNPRAIKDYKAIRVPFNEYEYTMLEKLATKTGRSKLNAIRYAITKLANED
jgi:hypothetical protein